MNKLITGCVDVVTAAHQVLEKAYSKMFEKWKPWQNNTT